MIPIGVGKTSDIASDVVDQTRSGYSLPPPKSNDGTTWFAYEMHAWPAFIIIDKIDKVGHIRFRWIGEGLYGGYAKMDNVIEALLSVPDPTVTEDF